MRDELPAFWPPARPQGQQASRDLCRQRSSVATRPPSSLLGWVDDQFTRHRLSVLPGQPTVETQVSPFSSTQDHDQSDRRAQTDLNELRNGFPALEHVPGAVARRSEMETAAAAGSTQPSADSENCTHMGGGYENNFNDETGFCATWFRSGRDIHAG